MFAKLVDEFTQSYNLSTASIAKMNKAIALILIILSFSCGTKNTDRNRIYIEHDKPYGKLENGIPEKDTLIELKNKKGTVVGIGRVALQGDYVSILKSGLWKEYDDNGVLIAEGNYKISSYIDCCVAGLCRIHYYYRTGEWKYFKKDGEIDFILEFKPEVHFVDTRCEGGDKMIFGLIKEIPLKFWSKVTPNKIFELQKISFTDSFLITTLTPLNGKIYIESEENF
jgi:hypothetical protein